MFKLQMRSIVMLIICPFAEIVWFHLYVHCPLVDFQILAQSILLLYYVSA